MKLIGLISTTRPHKIRNMIDSLHDCDDVIVYEDKDRNGANWCRNRLLEIAPDNCVVRFLDDDDIAFSTRQMYNSLIEKGADVLAASYVMNNQRIKVGEDAISASINSITPWNWVAKIDLIRNIKWNENNKIMMGSWHWIQFLENKLKIVTEPNIWCYHNISFDDGIFKKYSKEPTYELYEKLLDIILKNNRKDLLFNLIERMTLAGIKFDGNLIPAARQFKNTFGRYPNIIQPKTFSEKLFCRKMFDNNELYHVFCDKLKCKRWVAEKLGYDMAPKILWCGDEISDEAPINSLIKANHGSGWCFIYTNKNQKENLKKASKTWKDYGDEYFETYYKTSAKTILAEELLENVKDIKVFCYKNKVVSYFMRETKSYDEITGKFSYRITPFYKEDGSITNVRTDYTSEEINIDKPIIDEAKNLALKIADGLDFIRIDFLESNGKLYFGEITPLPRSGLHYYIGDYESWFGDEWHDFQNKSNVEGLIKQIKENIAYKEITDTDTLETINFTNDDFEYIKNNFEKGSIYSHELPSPKDKNFKLNAELTVSIYEK